VTVEGAVWLVRHGATTAAEGLTIGSSDLPLSSAGIHQAESIAAELAGRPLTRIFASDRLRALATAEAIASVHSLQVEVDSRLRELDFGAWEGRRLADLWVEDPDAAAVWDHDLWATPSSFGETLAQLEARVLAFWLESRPPSGVEVAVVAHRGSLAVLRALITGASLKSVLAAAMDMGTAIWMSPDA
jgi:broad specificity phosphatase PhoE